MVPSASGERSDEDVSANVKEELDEDVNMLD
jgi:hypothetical protein